MKKYIALLILVVFVSSCEKIKWPPVSFNRNITYKVSGSSNDYNIEYFDEFGNLKQINQKGEWTHKFKIKPEKYLYLFAKNMSDQGNVTVEIFKGDEVLISQTSNDEFGYAIVSGYLRELLKD